MSMRMEKLGGFMFSKTGTSLDIDAEICPVGQSDWHKGNGKGNG